MTNYKSLSLLVAFLCMLLASCTKEIPFDKNKEKPILIMNAVVDATQTSHDVFFALTDRNSPISVTGDISLTVSVNDKEIETITAPIEKNKITFSCVLKAGDKLRLQASDRQEHQVIAESIVPQAPKGVLTLRTEDYSWESNGNKKKGLKYFVDLDDPSEELTYYRLNSEIKMSKYLTSDGIKDEMNYPRWINTILIVDDVILSDGHPRSNPDSEDYDLMGTMDYDPNLMGIFNNKRFKNSACTLSYVISTYEMQSNNYYTDFEPAYGYSIDYAATVDVQRITAEAYKYFQLLNKLKSDNYSEMINEPIEVPSNVTGGTGFVTCINGISATNITTKPF